MTSVSTVALQSPPGCSDEAHETVNFLFELFGKRRQTKSEDGAIFRGLKLEDVDTHTVQALSISLSKCSVLPTNAMFIFKWSKVMMLRLSVEEAKMSISDTTHTAPVQRGTAEQNCP